MAEYIYGHPNKVNSWENVASIFAAHDSLNSAQTSSLPLVQFWKPEGNGVKDVLEESCGLNRKGLCETTFYFEYPVPVHQKCGGRGKASMTDLMIISNAYAIALEAKYTEYLKGGQESISHWLKKDKGESPTNREKVLQGWLNYISTKGCSTISQIKDRPKETDEVPYQLFHRLASACAATLDSERKPVVVYQLFCDEEAQTKAEESSGKLQAHFNVLKHGLGIHDVDFHVVITPVIRKPEFGTSKVDLEQLFLRMLVEDIFEFGKSRLPYDNRQ